MCAAAKKNDTVDMPRQAYAGCLSIAGEMRLGEATAGVKRLGESNHAPSRARTCDLEVNSLTL